MAFSEASGEIYFIRETDRLTNEESPYVKIGLVREADERDSAKRVEEHQTGNPRTLSLFEVVKTPFVSTAETILHSSFAPVRVRGEWFSLPGDDIQKAILKARAVAADLEGVKAIVDKAKALESVESTGEELTATDEIRGWHRSLLETKARMKFVAGLYSLLIIEAEAAAARGEDTAKVVQTQERKGRATFDEAAFKKDHLAIWEAMVIRSFEISQRFDLVGSRKLPDVAGFDPSLQAFADEIAAVASDVKTGSKSIVALHEKTLELDERTAMLKFDEVVLESKIKNACGVHVGIADVCSWKRTSVEKVKLDREKLKADYPDLVKEYTKVGEAAVAKIRQKQVAGD